MSPRTNIFVFAGMILAGALIPTAYAQFGQFYDSLPYGAYEHANADQRLHEPYLHPFIDPGYFNHDLQFFAPADDIDTYGGPVMRTGWFGQYNRMYLRVSRPDEVDSYDRMDRTWGNRWDVGYMIDDVDHDHGWLFTYMHVDGPNAWRVNPGVAIPDEIPPDPQPGEPVEPMQPPEVRGARDSLNVGDLTSFEVNKLFRTPPLNHGGILEPFFGFRYVKFVNIYQDDTIILYDDAGTTFVFPPVPPAGGLALDSVTIQDIISNRLRTTNHMIGGQLGFRWLKRVSRWNLSSEVRAFAFHNFQQMRGSVEANRTYYPDYSEWNPQDTEEAWNDEIVNTHTTETVVGTDIRAEAAFEVTRDVWLNGGMQFLGFFTGIGRGSLSDNSQDLVMVGFTFGVVVNR